MRREMPLTIVTCKLLFVILLPSVTKGVQTLSKYHITWNRRLSHVFKNVTAVSKIACCINCDLTNTCESVSYCKPTKECELSTIPLAGVTERSEYSTDCMVFSKNAWYLVFRGVADIGPDVYEAWLQGTNVTTDNEDCMSTGNTNCYQHYRSSLVDSWNNIGVTQVRFAFFKGIQEVANVTFNGVGSDNMNWFSTKRVVESTWDNLVNIQAQFFSIQGDPPARRFFICLKYEACPGDTMVALVISHKWFVCDFDDEPTYPKFLYSTTNTWIAPETGVGLGYADFIGIFIKA